MYPILHNNLQLLPSLDVNNRDKAESLMQIKGRPKGFLSSTLHSPMKELTERKSVRSDDEQNLWRNGHLVA